MLTFILLTPLIYACVSPTLGLSFIIEECLQCARSLAELGDERERKGGRGREGKKKRVRERARVS